MLFSPSTMGFYHPDIHGDAVPADCVEISAELHAELIGGQSEGNVIGVRPDGMPCLVPPLPPTAEQVRDMVARAVDAQLDALAQSWRYRNYISARAYKDDPNPRFAAEAEALINYGSACWTILDDLEAAVLAGEATMPATVEEVLALLPPTPARPA